MKLLKMENGNLFLKIIISVSLPILFYNAILPADIAQNFFFRSSYILLFIISLFFFFINLKFSKLLNVDKKNILSLSSVLICLFLYSLIQIPFHKLLNINFNYFFDTLCLIVYIFLFIPISIFLNSKFLNFKLSCILHLSFPFHLISMPIISYLYNWNNEGSLKILILNYLFIIFTLSINFLKIIKSKILLNIVILIFNQENK